MRAYIIPEIAGPVAFGSVVGAVVGSRMLLIVSNDRLRLLFVIILVALGIQMLLTVFGVHAGTGPL
jgi:uncharacterized membrane protein YfcA